MNTANLQLEGVYAAISALLAALRERNLLTTEEIEQALDAAERRIANDPDRPPELSAANVDAICFPLRYLRIANRLEAEGKNPPFTEIARLVGQREQTERA